MCDISFCLPCYQVKDFLKDCLQSIVSQKLDGLSYEILVVDDCSQDGSYEYLIELQQSIPSMRVLRNEENRGVSYTRNCLISEAKGKYIWFIDCDDMLYPNAFRTLWDIVSAENADVVVGNYVKVNEEDGPLKVEPVGNLDYYFPNINDFSWLQDKNGESRMKVIWRGMIRRDFLQQRKLQFCGKILFKEDALFYYEFFSCNPKVIKCEMPCYCYRQRATSVMNSQSEDKKKLVYRSTVNLIHMYSKLIESGNDFKNELVELVQLEKDDMIFGLACICDTRWVKKELLKLKQIGMYPHAFNKNIWKQRTSIAWKLIRFLLPIEMVFWFFHYIYKNVRK